MQDGGNSNRINILVVEDELPINELILLQNQEVALHKIWVESLMEEVAMTMEPILAVEE